MAIDHNDIDDDNSRNLFKIHYVPETLDRGRLPKPSQNSPSPDLGRGVMKNSLMVVTSFV